MLEVNEQLGYLAIPTIGLDLPIYAGTSAKVLEKGSGHLEGSSLPVGGQSTHSVLTAHRGLPSARLFTDLNQLKKGDRFYVTNLKETLAYKVNQIKVIEPSQLDALTIVEGKDYVTLLTCTPYMINSHRLLVRGERISLPLKKLTKKEKLDINVSVLSLVTLCGNRWPTFISDDPIKKIPCSTKIITAIHNSPGERTKT